FKVTVDLTDGVASGDLSVGTDNLVSIERVLGSQFSDTLIGTVDTFAELVGSKGGDTITGSGTGDIASYAGYYDSPAGVDANLGAGTASDGLGGTDTLKNIEWVTGSGFNDTITGSSAANTFTGGAGNDSLVGGAGIDTAVFSGNLAGYLVTFDGLGGATVKDT